MVGKTVAIRFRSCVCAGGGKHSIGRIVANHDVVDNDNMPAHAVTMPVHVGTEGEATLMAVTHGQTRRRSTAVGSRENVATPRNKNTAPPEERQEGGSPSENPATDTNSQSRTQKHTQVQNPYEFLQGSL